MSGRTFGQEYEDAFQYQLLGIAERYAQKSDSALLVLGKLAETLHKEPVKRGFTYLAIGKIHHYQKQDIAQAMTFFKKAAQLGQVSNDCTLQISSIVYQNLVHFAQGKMELFFQTYEQAAQIYQNCPQSWRGVYIYAQLSSNYLEEKQFKLAEKAAIQLDILLERQVTAFTSHRLFGYSALTKLAKYHKDTAKMNYYAQKAKALNLNQVHEAKGSIVSAYLNVATIFSEIGFVDSAIYYLQQVRYLPIDTASEVDTRLRMSADRALGDHYVTKGDYEKAAFHRALYVKWADSLIIKTRAIVVGKSLAKIENELALERKQRQLDRDRWIFIGISGLIAFILTILGLLYRNGRKLRQLNTLLQTQKDELSSLNEIRTNMFSVLSHDLVSPLGALQNMAELFQQGFFSESEFKDYVQSLKQQVEAMLKTIQSIVIWSQNQLNGKKPFIESLNFHTLVEEQFDLQQGAAQQKNIILRNDVPSDFKIVADHNQMSLVIRNLLDNAIKYSISGGQVTVSAWTSKTGKYLQIQDTGIGMSAEKIAQLFEPNPKKVNLGLRMVHDLVKANGYELTVESNPKEGSIFKLHFLN
jgi:signal transduction histidine kinase